MICWLIWATTPNEIKRAINLSQDFIKFIDALINGLKSPKILKATPTTGIATHVETVSHRADKHRVTERPLVTVGRRSNAVILHNLTLLNNDANVRIAIKQW
ncbi:hypothetical protein [Aeromonas salmonicida]|uniref:hypothetical protein n=1 Tax=Aeromonas salmonicida TaxID=645 RepID=UPI0005AB880A|nr:hypothetical protein [Aeromonas salmonicida]ASI23386.1 hypothetical protein CE456_12650 [Aeromonas salmonicida]ASI27702.1 hypothetical protein CE463_12675 [Aeromonas salmonicida]ASI31833.1 hypothetical protein CE462_11625 [Aeromonas salmonicida]ATD39110.1 hypothetical protein BHG40_15175 [Aeromonas salmonicida subsp. masoucida]